MAFTKEYARKIILSLDGVRKTERAQRTIYDKAFDKPTNVTDLTDGLSNVAGILGLIFLTSTATGVATGVFSIVAMLAPSEKDDLQDMVYEGYWNLGYLEDFLDDHPEYDLIEVNFPFIEYETQGVRFITGKGAVTRVHSGSGWILL
ncbi:hypothetical protein D3C76_1153810 [compost metagenome]|uniref:hypothetical protein n=1 Tax=Paenibacillus TaxID=44249 RepID=UPI00073E6FCC|nr:MULTISPECIES: hypothetical protein [Paenibacillus]MDU4695715.1 hypothetical protein [Paenibacillus sp.]